MKRKPLLWQLYPSYLFIILLSLVAVSWYASESLNHFYLQETSSYLKSTVQLIRENLPRIINAESTKKVDEICKEIGKHMLVRISVILPDGEVIGDSEQDPGDMGNQVDRPEIIQALSGRMASVTRYNPARDIRILWVAVPIIEKGSVIAIVRTASPLHAVGQSMRPIYFKIALGVLAIAGLAAIISFLISRRISQPLEEIKQAAERVAQGDFNLRLNIPNSKEVGSLAETMNQMAARLQHLDSLRRDFVANVSHELKTPITSIKGFVETLQDGAIDHPKDARRFLAIISKHADRLNVIIDDLFNLSHLEQEQGEKKIPLVEGFVRQVLQEAIQLCAVKARERKISLDLNVSEEISLPMNASLLEQAVVNLLDNALKYSDPGKSVRIDAVKTQRGVDIHVTDQGCGIEKEHLPRIFERFYRVDKARSRKLGGTGLGLAIVKHIAQVHGGNVSLESTPNKGSRFTIHLPHNT